MYVSPSVEVTHLTKPLPVSVMLQKLTSATGPFAAPESSESEASLNSLQWVCEGCWEYKVGYMEEGLWLGRW